MSSVPLIARDWQPQDPLAQYQKMQDLQERLRQGELDAQQKQLQIQAARMGIEQVQAMNTAYQNALSPAAPNANPRAGTPGAVPMAAPQATGMGATPMATPGATPGGGTPSNSTPVFDRNKIFNYLASQGQGSLLPGLQKSFADLDKTAADTQKLKDDHTASALEYFASSAKLVADTGYNPAIMGTVLAHAASNGYGPEANQVREELAQNPGQLRPFVDALIQRSSKQGEAAKNFAEAGKVPAEIGKITADTAKTQAEMPGGGLYAPSDNQLYSLATSPQTAMTPQGQQAAAVLARKQREKLQLAGAEAGARIAAENSPAAIAGAVNKKQALDAATGAGVQVYATDRTGRTMLMTKGDAVAQGFGYSKVGTSQISEDRQLNNRLADVQQKISQYEQSFQQPLDSHGWFSSSDRTLMAQVIGTDKLKAGVFGAELPVDFINKLGRSGLYRDMSPQAQQRIIAYFNARESIQGYQRVLTGSGRSSEKAMELNLDTLPAPIDPEGFAGNALKAFKQNLAIAGQGLPILPGVRTPEEVEQQVSGSK